MYMAVPDKRIFNTLCSTWHMFDKYTSLRQVCCNGWINNNFYDENIPYIWRDNYRIEMKRFWHVLEVVFAEFRDRDVVYLFHDKHRGWKRTAMKTLKNGVVLPSISEALHFIRRFSFYSKKHWNYGEASDNYNMLLSGNKIFVSFTHHGELLVFSEDVQLLMRIKWLFNKFRLVCNYEGNIS